jgi:two-component system sensor histidine kinase KdpD
LTVYLASAPGAGKTRRLLDDAHRLAAEGVRVALGWIETKGRPDLDDLVKGLPVIAPRFVERSGSSFAEFDFEAALAAKPQVIVLDELAHANLDGSAHAKRWQDALALREAGISVIGAFNIMHLETIAPTAERLIGFPVREIVPMSFLRAADQVIALDVAPDELIARLVEGRIVRADDIERTRGGLFRAQTLAQLRELLLRTIDDLTVPELDPKRTSSALAIVTPDIDESVFLARVNEMSDALDLQLTTVAASEAPLDFGTLKAAMIVVPSGDLATRIASGATERDVLILDSQRLQQIEEPAFASGGYSQFAGDRQRVGYGKLTIYVGSAAGSGKTYAMLDRAHRLLEDEVDVVAAFVETHGRADTERMLEGIEVQPRLKIVADGISYGELDVDATIARHPKVALIDELAHTNAPGAAHAKRYDDVMSVLRAGISVITTLNVQHLEGLNDAVFRLTGTRVRETLPDEILTLADDVIFIDVTPDVLRERLRRGKIYPPERIEAALANFFKTENLAALRELAVREVVRARASVRKRPPLRRLVLGVKAREREIALIERCGRLTRRLDVDLSVVHVGREESDESRTVEALEAATRRVRARWVHAHGRDVARALIEAAAAQGATTIAIEGSRRKPRWPQPATFARRLIDAGARQLFILAPVEAEGG